MPDSLVMSGWGQPQACLGVRGKGQGSSLVSDLIRGLLPAKSKASEVSAEHTQHHWEIKGPDGYYTVCVSYKKKKNLEVTVTEAVHWKRSRAHEGNPWLGSAPEGSFLVRSFIVWYVVQNMLTGPYGNLAEGRGHRDGKRHRHIVEVKNTSPYIIFLSFSFWCFRKLWKW